MENSCSEMAVKNRLGANWTLWHLLLTAYEMCEGMQSAQLHTLNPTIFARCQDAGDPVSVAACSHNTHPEIINVQFLKTRGDALESVNVKCLTRLGSLWQGSSWWWCSSGVCCCSRVNSDGFTSLLALSDIDECANDTICGNHGFCENTDGSFRCHCDQGYTNPPGDTSRCVGL